MAGDRDLSSLLPDAPPPRPARRAAAIDAALRRFDGIPDPPSAAAAVPSSARPAWWQRFAGPQASAVMAILLVALIALPVWVFDRDRIVPPAAVPERGTPSADLPGRAPEAPVGDARPAAPDTQQPAAPKAAESRSVPASTGAALATPSPTVSSFAAEPAPAPAAAPPPPAAEQDMVVTARRREESVQDVPVAVTVVGEEPLQRFSPNEKAEARAGSADDASEVVVTGTRINPQDARIARAASRRGDWNACTIYDPQRSVEKCRKRVDPATPLGEGIVAAWKGDLDGAIAAFDRAIAAEPRKAAAWLNRGLAHAQEGDYDKALADLDRAASIEPGAARNFYHRSVVHRRLGDTRRADRDATRVLEMDSRYRDLIP